MWFKREQPKLIDQLFPVITCFLLFATFIWLSYIFIDSFINPFSAEKIKITLYPVDVFVGFFLYFVTAVDYALIVGRMQTNNPGFKPRFIMNIFTCVGCFFGVSIVLFLWGFAKEIPWLILPILLFAGSIMIKLAHDGIEFYEHTHTVPAPIRHFTTTLIRKLYYVTHPLTYWMPELGSPNVKRLTLTNLALWSFFLPFIIGLDDLVGYMGAMTIYNAFSLLFGIYLADVVIDILIFVNPKLTTKIVENPLLSVVAAYAFIYLAYKSFSESVILMHEKFHIGYSVIVGGLFVFTAVIAVVDFIKYSANKK